MSSNPYVIHWYSTNPSHTHIWMMVNDWSKPFESLSNLPIILSVFKATVAAVRRYKPTVTQGVRKTENDDGAKQNKRDNKEDILLKERIVMYTGSCYVTLTKCYIVPRSDFDRTIQLSTLKVC